MSILKAPISTDEIRNCLTTLVTMKVFTMYSIMFSNLPATLHIILPKMATQLQRDWLPKLWPLSNSEVNTPSAKRELAGTRCPYEYILNVYGNNHFKKIIQLLDPSLQHEDPSWYELILEIMDAIHFGAILVDDVADNSMLRKGHTAAHRIFGSSETINRAYLRIFQVIEKCRIAKPSAVSFILDNLTQIHKGKSPKQFSSLFVLKVSLWN
jgi:hypothetical protein